MLCNKLFQTIVASLGNSGLGSLEAAVKVLSEAIFISRLDRLRTDRPTPKLTHVVLSKPLVLSDSWLSDIGSLSYGSLSGAAHNITCFP